MRARRTIAIITALLGLGLLTAGPASAEPEIGTWVPYGNKNPITTSSSHWRCASSVEVSTSVAAQVCSIRSRDGLLVQSAVIVRNNRSGLFSTTASMSAWNPLNDEMFYQWNCPSSGVGANSWSVCFSDSFIRGELYSKGYAKGQYLGRTGTI
jgi:hypothetical protein